MDALYVVLAVGVAAALAIGSRSWSRRDRSVERYEHALETLAEVTQRPHSDPKAPAEPTGREGDGSGGHGERRLVFDALGDDRAGGPTMPDRPRPRLGPGSRLGARPARRPTALGGLVGLLLLGSLAFLVVTLVAAPRKAAPHAASRRAATQSRPGGTATRSGRVHATGKPTSTAARSDRSGPRSASSRPATTAASPTSATAPPGARAVITALEPASGTPGSSITIVGSRLFSANGRILVTFDGRATGTRCPTEERCIAAVPPPPGGSATASVEVVTQTGPSNALAFTYR